MILLRRLLPRLSGDDGLPIIYHEKTAFFARRVFFSALKLDWKMDLNRILRK